MWGYMLSKMGNTQGLTIDKFKLKFSRTCAGKSKDALCANCDAFVKCLKLTIKDKGERFELKS